MNSAVEISVKKNLLETISDAGRVEEVNKVATPAAEHLCQVNNDAIKLGLEEKHVSTT